MAYRRAALRTAPQQTKNDDCKLQEPKNEQVKTTNLSNKWLSKAGLVLTLAAVALFAISCATTHEAQWDTKPDPSNPTKGGAAELMKRPR